MTRACILVADDNQKIRSSLRALFERHEKLQVCYEAQNGKEAVEKATAHRPGLIILDFMMPVMNGLEAAEHLSKQLPGVPVILCTLHADVFEHAQAKLVGVSRVVSKLETDALVKHAEELISAT